MRNLGSGSSAVPPHYRCVCDDGACARSRDNTASAGAERESTGVSLGNTDTLVDSNVIECRLCDVHRHRPAVG